MPKSPVQTYTISADSLHSSNTPHLEIPTNGNDIQIIITQSTPPEHDTPSRLHFIESNPTNKRTLTRIETPKTMPNIEIIEIPSSDRNNISRNLQTDFNNTSVSNWIATEKSFSTNSDRYIDVQCIKVCLL